MIKIGDYVKIASSVTSVKVIDIQGDTARVSLGHDVVKSVPVKWLRLTQAEGCSRYCSPSTNMHYC